MRRTHRSRTRRSKTQQRTQQSQTRQSRTTCPRTRRKIRRRRRKRRKRRKRKRRSPANWALFVSRSRAADARRTWRLPDLFLQTWLLAANVGRMLLNEMTCRRCGWIALALSLAAASAQAQQAAPAAGTVQSKPTDAQEMAKLGTV